jgi:GAF domain-containing protein
LRGAVATARTAACSDAAELREAVDDQGRIDSSAVAYNVFAKVLASDGLRSALYALLRRCDYRFIGIFRFKDGKATSVVHVDRENLSVLRADEVPDTATYCSFVRADLTPFVTQDARVDPRTQEHSARDVVQAYCGLPVMADDSKFIGTLCLYDVVPRNPDQLDLDLLSQACEAIGKSGLVPDYPSST